MDIPLVDYYWWTFFFRWTHVLAGVMWIGLLWYFNFVQIPNMPKIPDEQKPAIGKVIAPAALFLVPLGGARHGRNRHRAGVDERVLLRCHHLRHPRCRDRRACVEKHRHRYRDVARHHHDG